MELMARPIQASVLLFTNTRSEREAIEASVKAGSTSQSHQALELLERVQRMRDDALRREH